MDINDEYTTIIGYQDRIEDPENEGQIINNPEAFVMPTIPPQPAWRDDFSLHKLKIYQAWTCYYCECSKYNQEGIDAIKHKFPEALVALEVAPGRLPVDITLTAVCNHLLNQARNAGTDTSTCCSLITKLLDLPYIPNKN